MNLQHKIPAFSTKILLVYFLGILANADPITVCRLFVKTHDDMVPNDFTPNICFKLGLEIPFPS